MGISCKWPLMLVRGQRVQPEQAIEIIRRTDTFWKGYGGNDRDFDDRVWRAFGCPSDEDFDAYWETKNKWEEDWGYINTQYVDNSFISSAYIGGPSGWVWPSGKIENDKNIGKWPSIEEVVDDWKKIAEAFPFLKLDAVLYGHEGTEDGNDMTDLIRVRKGVVTHTEDQDEIATAFSDFGMEVNDTREGQKAESDANMSSMIKSLMMPAELREHFWTEAQIREMWADRLVVEGE